MQQGSSGAGSSGATATMTDEQILEMETAPAALDDAAAHVADAAPADAPPVRMESARASDLADGAPAASLPPGGVAESDPAWLRALDAQPLGGREAAAEARQWRDSARDVASLDAAYFGADASARSGLAGRLYESDPAAFRAMLAESARMLSARDPQALAELARELGVAQPAIAPPQTATRSLSQAARSTGHAQASSQTSATGQQADSASGPPQTANAVFPADAYRAFEAATNDDVSRRLRDAIDRTLGSTLPDGIAEGARRRIGEDIVGEIHASLASDRDLTRQVTEMLRDWRFDSGTRQQVASLVAGRARTMLPEVARRVVAEWTSSVLASNRARTARQDAAASRRDITGGRLPEPVPSSSIRPRDIDYRRTSDEQILEL